jgi:hypothetical protein
MAVIQQDSNAFARVLKQTIIQLPEPQTAPFKLDQPRLVWPAARVLTWVLLPPWDGAWFLPASYLQRLGLGMTIILIVAADNLGAKMGSLSWSWSIALNAPWQSSNHKYRPSPSTTRPSKTRTWWRRSSRFPLIDRQNHQPSHHFFFHLSCHCI